MNTDTEFEARLRTAAAGMQGPSPSAAALEEILSRRARGERVPLDPPRPTQGGTIMRWMLLGTAAALALTLFRSVAVRTPGGAGGNPVSTFVLPQELAAAAVDHPSFPVVAPGRPLAAGRWRYIFADAPGQAPDTAVIWEMSVAAVPLDSQRTARYVYGGTERGGTGLAADTLWFRATDMRPLSLHATRLFGPATETDFHPDQALVASVASVALQDTLPGTGASGGRQIRVESTFGHNHMWRPSIDAVLRSAELSDGWRASMWLPMFGENLWIDLQVVGRETIAVPAGRFDCWKVRVGLRGGIYAWVSTDRQWLVRLGAESRGEQQLLVEAEER